METRFRLLAEDCDNRKKKIKNLEAQKEKLETELVQSRRRDAVKSIQAETEEVELLKNKIFEMKGTIDELLKQKGEMFLKVNTLQKDLKVLRENQIISDDIGEGVILKKKVTVLEEEIRFLQNDLKFKQVKYS